MSENDRAGRGRWMPSKGSHSGEGRQEHIEILSQVVITSREIEEQQIKKWRSGKCFFRYGKTSWGSQIKWGGQALQFPGLGWETVSTKAYSEIGTCGKVASRQQIWCGGKEGKDKILDSVEYRGSQMDGQQGDWNCVLGKRFAFYPLILKFWIMESYFYFKKLTFETKREQMS